MILNKNQTEIDSLLTVNNDIYRIITAFNNNMPLKQLLVNTGFKPLQGEQIEKDLRDTQISRVPLIPFDEEEGSIIVVTLINGEKDFKSGTMGTELAIDVFSPGNQ